MTNNNSSETTVELFTYLGNFGELDGKVAKISPTSVRAIMNDSFLKKENSFITDKSATKKPAIIIKWNGYIDKELNHLIKSDQYKISNKNEITSEFSFEKRQLDYNEVAIFPIDDKGNLRKYGYDKDAEVIIRFLTHSGTFKNFLQDAIDYLS